MREPAQSLPGLTSLSTSQAEAAAATGPGMPEHEPPDTPDDMPGAIKEIDLDDES